MASKRIELGDGKWAEVRPLTAGDLRAQRFNSAQRGFPDDILDGMFLVVRRVSAWSYGEVNDAVLDTIPIDDLTPLLNEIGAKDDGLPNSPGSSNGASSTLISEEPQTQTGSPA